MAKFPILEWKEIDGIDTPFTYPQHEKKDGSFVVTGENDPLPVAGYGMTDNGIWIPKRVNDDGSVNTRLTGSIVEEQIAKEVSVGAGAEVIVANRLGLNDCKYFSFVVSNDTSDPNKAPSHSAQVMYRYIIKQYSTYRSSVDYMSGGTKLLNYGNVTGKIENLNDLLHMYIINKDTVDHSYDVWIRRYY